MVTFSKDGDLIGKPLVPGYFLRSKNHQDRKDLCLATREMVGKSICLQRSQNPFHKYGNSRDLKKFLGYMGKYEMNNRALRHKSQDPMKGCTLDLIAMNL